jgi:DNA repair photolyase
MPDYRVMRWDNLKVESDESRTLPGYREPATVRTFDAPEAMDIRFYEVRAKSALNRVPKASRMPFRWTINPYRGCAHACTYCLEGGTRVLTADGRTKPIADLRPGDRVYGTVRSGSYRRYTPTEVLDHWATIDRAYRIMLADGTELVASADHRFLSARGKWKHVTDAEHGPDRRPHLTLNDKLLGTGGFAEPPEHSRDYQLGYVCGMVRGDGTVGSHDHPRTGRTDTDVHHSRLALTDLEPLQRTRDFLRQLDLDIDERAFAAASVGSRPLKRARAAPIMAPVEWPVQPSEDWCKGYLAGIVDAAGSYSRGILRIPTTEAEVIEHTLGCLARLGLPSIVEDPVRANGIKVVRVPGGLEPHLRFFHLVDPATTRKRRIDGAALESPARLQVVAIEPLDVELPLYDITTGTGDFIANGVVSHNCFARPTHTYLDFDAGRDFEREIVVKVNVPEVARAELMRSSWKREHVALGTNTDPYQWVESRYKLMPGIWEAMRDSGTPCSVLTKSPLLLRDLDLMKEIHDRVGFAANLSIPTLDEKAWRATEPHTPHPRKRIEAVAEINRAGVPCGVLIAPLMPGINDDPKQVEKILELCTEAGAVNIGGICLHLRGEVKGLWMEWLRSNRPDLVPRYERLYARSAYAPKAEQERLAALARPGVRVTPARPRGGAIRDGGPQRKRSDPRSETDPVATPRPPEPEPKPEQTTLF